MAKKDLFRLCARYLCFGLLLTHPGCKCGCSPPGPYPPILDTFTHPDTPTTDGMTIAIPAGLAGTGGVPAEWEQAEHLVETARNVNLAAGSVLSYLLTAGFLTEGEGVRRVTLSSGEFTMKLTANAVVTLSVVPDYAAYDFAYKFEMWDANDVKTMELFFNELVDPPSGDGVVLRFFPAAYSSLFAGGDIMVESRLVNVSGVDTQILTLEGTIGPGGEMDRIRVLLRRTSDFDTLRFTGVARMTDAASCAGAEADYLTVAQISEIRPPYNATVRWGLENQSTGDTLCGALNASDDGLFDSINGFICDGADAPGCQTLGIHPSVADVLNLFDELPGLPYLATGDIDVINIQFESSGGP